MFILDKSKRMGLTLLLFSGFTFCSESGEKTDGQTADLTLTGKSSTLQNSSSASSDAFQKYFEEENQKNIDFLKESDEAIKNFDAQFLKIKKIESNVERCKEIGRIFVPLNALKKDIEGKKKVISPDILSNNRNINDLFKEVDESVEAYEQEFKNVIEGLGLKRSHLQWRLQVNVNAYSQAEREQLFDNDTIELNFVNLLDEIKQCEAIISGALGAKNFKRYLGRLLGNIQKETTGDLQKYKDWKATILLAPPVLNPETPVSGQTSMVGQSNDQKNNNAMQNTFSGSGMSSENNDDERQSRRLMWYLRLVDEKYKKLEKELEDISMFQFSKISEIIETVKDVRAEINEDFPVNGEAAFKSKQLNKPYDRIIQLGLYKVKCGVALIATGVAATAAAGYAIYKTWFENGNSNHQVFDEQDVKQIGLSDQNGVIKGLL
ncbi:hypothetical protein IPH25_01310 [bacterium]|nr:MAG: hypothetical protein IPG37_03435 [bacterium]QQR62065.1 MAG: hypothetical protein IPH25_01310 [bacterium]QQR62341.1 MAG: hypothetical protein IPH67_02825 [bacterium]